MANTSRMTSYQRREQLIEIGRSLFASKGFEAVSVEEIAATAKVSKPIVYEHFGGKEGLYAVVVDREMRALTDTLVNALSDPQAHPRQIVERTALALLTYVEENAEGFRVLTRDSPKTDPASSFNSLLGDIALRVEDILAEAFKRQHLPAKGVPYYAQMLIGMTVYTCQYWADQRKLSKEQIAAHIVNLAWHGLSRMEAKPELRFESDKATKEAEKQERREIKEIAKRERKAAKEAQSQNNTESPAEQNAEQNTEQDAAGSQGTQGRTAVEQPSRPQSSQASQPTPTGARRKNRTVPATGESQASHKPTSIDENLQIVNNGTLKGNFRCRLRYSGCLLHTNRSSEANKVLR